VEVAELVAVPWHCATPTTPPGRIFDSLRSRQVLDFARVDLLGYLGPRGLSIGLDVDAPCGSEVLKYFQA
jgi:hypothetical protein